MDLQKFKETYKQVIAESADNSELKNYIRSIVEEVLEEARMPIDKKDASMRITKKSHPKLYNAIRAIQEPFNRNFPITDWYVDGPVPSNETEKAENLEKLKVKLDKLEKIAGTEAGSKNKELQKFLSDYAPEERQPVKYDRSKDPYVDDEGYPLSWDSVTDYEDGYPVARTVGLKKISKSKKRDPYYDDEGYPRAGAEKGKLSPGYEE